MSQRDRTGRLPSLDGIRALAIIAVLIAHVRGGPDAPAWLACVTLDSGLAVRAFFVLSGFLITHLLLAERERSGRVSLGRFYRRRAARILPVFWTYLLCVACLRAAGVEAMPTWELLMVGTFTNHLWFWPPGGESMSTTHTWSLAIEEQFYLVWPLVVALASRGRWPIVRFGVPMATIAVALVVEPVFRCGLYLRARESWKIHMAVSNLDFLGWGCLLALLWHAFPDAVGRFLAWRPAVGRALAAVVVFGTPWYVNRLFPTRYVWSAWSIQAGAVAYLIGSLAFVQRGVAFRVLNARPVVAVGLLSYSLYVWHEAFRGGQPLSPFAWRRWPLDLVLPFVAACASYWLIEQPARRWAARASRRDAVLAPA